jgi:hypothetical protein
MSGTRQGRGTDTVMNMTETFCPQGVDSSNLDLQIGSKFGHVKDSM